MSLSRLVNLALEGSDDIIWQSDDGIVRDWLGLGNATFVGNTDKVNITTGTDWHVLGTGDFNGDGYTDVLWQHDNGTVRDWLGQADGSFVGNIDQVNILTGTDWHVRGTGDFNGDGRDDILWQNDNGTIRDWLGQADGSFLSNIDVVNFVPGAGWQIAGTGDFNGDGRSDILARNTDGTITDWLGQADGGFTDNSLIASQPVSTDLQVAGVGDFNGDGFSDVLFRDSAGALQTWRGDISGNLLSPLQQLWQDALMNVAQFFTDIAYGDGSSDHTDQYSYQPQGSYYEALFPADTTMDWLADVEAWNASSFSELLPQNSPYFGVVDSGTGGFSASFGEDSFGSITSFDASSETFLLQMNGFDLLGQWHPGAAPDSVSADSNSIVIVGHRNEESRVSFGYTGYFSFNPLDSGYDLSGSFAIGNVALSGPQAAHVTDATPTSIESAAAAFSLDFLYKHSSTAKALIDAIVANGTSLNLISANLAGFGAQDSFDKDNNQILWDPFMWITGTNSDGSTYNENPMMLLAHELIHAGHASDPLYQGSASETLVMSIANQIAAEINSSAGTHFDTSRDNHDGQRNYTTSPTSTLFSIARPGS